MDIEITSSQQANELERAATDQAERNRIASAWRTWLYETQGGDLPKAVLDLVCAKAYEDGDAYGFTEIEGHFIDLVELAENIIAVARR